MSLVSDILQACAVSPQPWFAGDFVRGRSESIEDITFCLNVLCQTNVLRLVMSEDRQRAGFSLTPRGAELARDPQAIARFVEAEGLDLASQDSVQARAVRQLFHEPPRPRINRVLLLLNLLVFGSGLFLAWQKNSAGDFLMPVKVQRQQNGPQQGQLEVVMAQNPDLHAALIRTGLLTHEGLLDGEWWRLLACGFVHIGLIHLAVNMYALRVLGSDCEWLWGSGRYLVLYLLSILGGSCAAMTQPAAVGGASGALCGLLGAIAAWTLLNRRYLPRRIVRRQMRAMLINVTLITLISLAPGVSGAAHFGGAVVGVATALLLHLHRFGGPLAKQLASLAVLAIPIGCLVGLHRTMQSAPLWQEIRAERQRRAEEQRADRDEKALVALRSDQRRLQGEVGHFHKTTLAPLLETMPAQRDGVKLAQAVVELGHLISSFHRMADESSQLAGPRSPVLEEFRTASQDYFQRRADSLERMRLSLRDGVAWKRIKNEEVSLQSAQLRWVKAFNALSRVE